MLRRFAALRKRFAFVAGNDGAIYRICKHDNCETAHLVALRLFLNSRCKCMCAVQKWHTYSRKISLRPAFCLAKINRAGWRGLSSWRLHTCTDHRSRWPLLPCAPRPPRPATSHPSTWRRAEFMRPPRTSMCVRGRPSGHRLTQNPVTTIAPTKRLPLPTAPRQRSMANTATPRSRSMWTERPPIPSATTLRSVTTRRTMTTRSNTRRGRRCPCPTARERGATTAMAGGRTATRLTVHTGFVAARTGRRSDFRTDASWDLRPLCRFFPKLIICEAKGPPQVYSPRTSESK